MPITIFLGNDADTSNIHFPKQCHGNHVVELITGDEDVSDTDALTTRNKNIVLGIKTADCAPICFTSADMIGIAHIGWRGFVAGLFQKIIAMFPLDTEIWIGPHMHIFEIQKDECYDLILASGFGHHIHEHEGILKFHFKDALLEIAPRAVCDSRNTYTDVMLPSYRCDKTLERIITTVSF
jgi:copper oxidase (laccase) domain-containing protein